MTKIDMKSKGATARSSEKKHRRILSVAVVMLVCCLAFVGGAVGADGNVAIVGNTEYATIDEAISKWNNNQELTLLADVTLSDVVQLKSTEHHTLNLGIYTMTAAEGKNAIEIIAYGTGDAERNALTIKADAKNPGGINAGKKSIVYYDYSKGQTTGNDRPIINIEGGKFIGSTSSVGTAGIYAKGTAARKCATFKINGGTFECSILGTGKSKMLITGGTFHNSVGSQGDSTCYRLISGGTFKSFGFMTADAANKFGVGSALSTYDKGVYVNDDGYLVVGGPVITEAGQKFVAKTDNYGGWHSYLKYSSAASNNLYYTSVKEICADNNKASDKIVLLVDSVDMTEITYKGHIILTDSQTLTLTYPEETTPTWKVFRSDENEIKGSTSVAGGVVTHTYADTVKIITFNTNGGSDIPSIELAYGEAITAPEDPTKEGHTFEGWYSDDTCQNKYELNTQVTEDLTLYANWTVNQYTITFNTDGGSAVEAITQDYKTAVTAPANPTKTGYTFTSWKPEIPATMPVNGLSLTAQWTANTYTVSFNAEGGTATLETLSVTYDAPYANLPNAEKERHTFLYWKHEDGSKVTNETEVKTAKDHTLTAVWEEIPSDEPTSSSSGGEGGYLSFPRTTSNGGLVDFGSSKVVKALMLPEGSSGSVILKVDTIEKWPKELETEYTFDISVAKLGEGMSYILFEIPLSTLESLELTPADICAYHFADGEWVKLKTTYEVKDGTVCYESETDSFSPFKLVIEKGSAVQKEEENIPTVPPTEEPEDNPQEILPPIPPVEPTEPESPSPILPVLAGLGAAAVLRRK